MMARLRWPAVLLLLFLPAGCGEDRKEVLAPPAETTPAALGPEIGAVHPDARSTGILYDSDIWVSFVTPLEPGSVNERTVFLKLDTARIPVTLTYEAPARTIHLLPRVRLALLRTYTVEITAGVRTTAGHPLSQASFWQFRTNGLRRIEHPTPPTATQGESPFALLGWDETEPSAGAIVYRVYAGADSAAVAAHGASLISLGSNPFLLPSRPWTLGARVYWAVSAENRTSGDTIEGPVWSFATLPPGLPVDSLIVPAPEWGYYDFVSSQKTCLGGFLFMGGGYSDGIHWSLQENAANLKLAGARIRMYGVANNPLSGQPAVYPVRVPWASCTYSATVPIVENTKLADAVRIGFTPYVMFESDALTAWVEAGARYGLLYGCSFRAGARVSFLSPLYAGDGPLLTLYYYRVPPAPAAQGP